MEVTADIFQSNISIYTDIHIYRYTSDKTDGYSGYDKIAACVYSVTLTIVGLIGNSHALIINVQRFRSQRREEKNPYVVFVLSLAILDMFTSLVILPMDNADLAYRFTPYSDDMCKFFRYLQFVIHFSSVLHTVLISIHCCRQVCFPKSRQINGKYAFKFCVCLDLFSATGAVIVIFLSGSKTITIDGVTGAFCFIGESSNNPMFLRIAMTILSVGFVICLVVIVSCYCALIVKRWHKRSKSNHSMNQDEIKLQKPIVTLIIVTASFVIAYIPFMILAVIKTVDKDFQNNLSGASSAAHGIFVRFPLVNNVVNPFIYGLKDLEFRQRLLNMYPCLKSSKTQEIEIDSNPSPK